MSTSPWISVPHDQPPRMAAGVVGARAKYAPADFVTLLWRERFLMLVVFVAIVALGFGFALTLKKNYTAQGAVFAGVGQEYVYQPRVGTAERGQAPQGDEVANSEAAILSSGQVRQRVVEALGPAAILGKTPTGSRDRAEAAARKLIGASLSVGTAPGSAILRTSSRSSSEKCRPTPNISNITPISANWPASATSATKPGVPGPIITPASK